MTTSPDNFPIESVLPFALFNRQVWLFLSPTPRITWELHEEVKVVVNCFLCNSYYDLHWNQPKSYILKYFIFYLKHIYKKCRILFLIKVMQFLNVIYFCYKVLAFVCITSPLTAVQLTFYLSLSPPSFSVCVSSSLSLDNTQRLQLQLQ